ncbi:AAA family ATPase [Paeniroseomonas aquatica]|uniref:AAA family ATPase n=1 Tax=Paeniroseomonas aquatica TaxID=373043 RepID=UPI003611102A
MRLAVMSILSSRSFGCLWAGVGEAGERIRVKSDEPVWPVVGEVYDVEGAEEAFEDSWGRRHRQISGARLTRIRASGRLLVPWLRQLPGVGETRATRLLERFGNDLLDVLSDPARVGEVADALDPERQALAARLAIALQVAYAKQACVERDKMSEGHFYARLEEVGVADRTAARSLWRLLGNDAWERLCQRPYTAAVVIPWERADHLGQRLLSAATGTLDLRRHPDRLAGACDSVIRDLLRQGDTAADPDEFRRRLSNKAVSAKEALKTGLERRRVLAFQDLIVAPGAAYLEGEIYRHIQRLRAASAPYSLATDDRAEKAIETAERTTGLVLTGEQRTAVRVLLHQGVGLLQGGAGTGKTTSMRVLVAACNIMGRRVEPAALSGKAALKLAQASQFDALTIAQVIERLKLRDELEAEGRLSSNDDYLRGENGLPLKRLPRLTSDTTLLLDEASMVDIASLHRLLGRLPDGGGLILVGDFSQLPPVGIGQVYHDLVEARHGVVELTQILRQADGNPLLAVAAAIRHGQVPLLPKFTGAATGVQFQECTLKGLPIS